MTSLLLDVVRATLGWVFLVYTVVAASHFLLQLWFAHRTFRRQTSPSFELEYPDLGVDVDVLIPVYNEDPILLEACVRSALGQDHAGRVKVIVVDDGSPNRARLEPIYDALETEGVTVIRSAQNQGKRHAQGLGMRAAEGEIIVTLDSDTVLRPDAIRRLTRQFRDPRVGAATGFVDVENYRKNVLTRLQRLRYWMAFNQERAAQSWFRTMLCCSGPLAAYRRDIVESVRDAYLNQIYGGITCTFGDDRHLTNLVLDAGYDTVFDAGAVAYTHVPEGVRQFIRQQLRWSKSFYRELVWTVPYIGTRPWYSRFDLVSQVAMPLMLTITAPSAAILGLLSSPVYLLNYVALIAAVAAIRATYPAIRNRDPSFYLFVVYGFVSAFLIMSVRLVALSTLTDARWGTRGPVRLKTQRWKYLRSIGAAQLSLAAAGGAGSAASAPAVIPGHVIVDRRPGSMVVGVQHRIAEAVLVTRRTARLNALGRQVLVTRVEIDGWSAATAAHDQVVSRETARRWVTRYRAEGWAGLENRSSRPHHSPRLTPPDLVEAILRTRVERRWGPRRIGRLVGVPPSTVYAVLARAGCSRLRDAERLVDFSVSSVLDAPEELVHKDAQEVGRIADGGQHRLSSTKTQSVDRTSATAISTP